jgi:hypothetical protein
VWPAAALAGGTCLRGTRQASKQGRGDADERASTVMGGGFESKEKKLNSIQLKRFQNASNFDHQKNVLPELQKFEINYVLKLLKR